MQLWPWHNHGVHCLEITSLSRVWCRALPKCCSFACNCVQCKVCSLCSVLKVECSSGCSGLLHLQSWSALSHIQAFQNISHEFPMNFHSEMVIKYFPSKIWVLTFSENVFANWIALAGFSYAPLDVWQLQKVHHTEYIIISIDWSAQWKGFFWKVFAVKWIAVAWQGSPPQQGSSNFIVSTIELAFAKEDWVQEKLKELSL